MIRLEGETSIALFCTLLKQNYGISWRAKTDNQDYFLAGLHTPEGEVAYYVPVQAWSRLDGMITLDQPDHLDSATQTQSAERLHKWSKTL